MNSIDSNSDKPPSSFESDFRKEIFPDVEQKDWESWKWQLQNSFRSYLDLVKFLKLSESEFVSLSLNETEFPVSITPYYASLIYNSPSDYPIRRMVIPTQDEKIISEGESNDPLGEEHDSPVPGIVHRYPDRVLFITTDYCASYCRYCTRSRMVGKSGCSDTNHRYWDKAIEYIRNNTNIRDVLLSGGDPLTLPDNKLYELLERIKDIDHIEFIRIGSKVPIVLPQRITKSFTHMLSKFHPLWMSLHFTHPDEITPDVEYSCNLLADAGIPLGSQTVLLKGINDNVETLKRLYHKLLKIRVRPYYLYICDNINGSAHFRTSVKKGMEMIEGLRGHTTGYAIPQFVIDLPEGGGKMPVLPDYLQYTIGNEYTFKTYQGNLVVYKDYSYI